jgi:hypothetical protein
MKYYVLLFTISAAFFVSSCEMKSESNYDDLLKKMDELAESRSQKDTVFVYDTIRVTDSLASSEIPTAETAPNIAAIPIAMNVLYRGIDNPIEIFTGSTNADEVEVSMSNGTILSGGKPGRYVVKPGKGGKSVLSFKVDGANGGVQEFRVKNVPSPDAYFAGVTGSGNVPKTKLMAAAGVVAKMSYFEFDVKWIVTEFELTAFHRGKMVTTKSSGNRVTGEMKNLLKATRKGEYVFISGIKAKGPDGSVRDLGSIRVKVL